ncbi:alpha-(1,3)-fucosyltransferase 10-like [Pectinophora gossypiella]|uniref:alpha-(1,3)-fucosyltransferase 10-like n=1 Tax=Pectinophora gossypiella TaxID=13191 RepID=UPI00214EBD12|nr:alpha-(1,3)-fucosyltransferase 10-like [Pectinophora gossypiella]
MDKLPLPRDRETIWGVFHEESPLIRLTFMYEEGLNLFNYSATFSRFSDLPVPLIWMKSLEAITSPLYFINSSVKTTFLSQLAPVMYLQSDCNTSTDRDAYVQKLMQHISVDSYGACLRNKPLPLNGIYSNEGFYKYMQHLFGQELLRFMARYKFMITIENSVCNDYVTEKLWRAIEVGVVPIYYGSPLIRDWLPNNKSAILLEDFPTPELLSQHLHYLLNNDTAYEEYLEHKTLGTIANRRLIEEVAARPYQMDLQTARKEFECYVCERLYTRRRNEVHIVTKKHYDCPLPRSALTLSVNESSSWLERIRKAKIKIEKLQEEIRTANRTLRSSVTSFDFDGKSIE